MPLIKSFKYNSGKNNVVVAVIDTGLNVNSQNILQGYNILNNSNDVSDNTGHGTEVTKLIMKVNPNVKILPIKIVDNSSEAKPEVLANAIQFAIDRNVDVINISLGMASANQKVKEQVLNAISKNIPIVSSAGNIGENLLYPASEEKVFSVIARDINNVDVAFSNKGTKKSFSCPGVHILIDNQHYVSGTSFACSFLTGTIALIKQNKGDYSIDGLYNVLKKSTVDGNKYSYGLIQLDRIAIK